MTAPFTTGPGWRSGAPPRLAAIFVVLAATILATGCSRRPSPAPLEHTFESPEALAREVLKLVEFRDTHRLGQLALSEREFADLVWPELPASRPERNLPLDYVWTDLRTKSRAHLGRIAEQFGGRRYELVGVSFRGETTTYRSYAVHRKAELIVRAADGNEDRLRLFGSVLERGGRYKLFSFVVD
ncbi:MAG: hypothetical protein KJ066_20510 [Acidobacteria bacterium]|nr:hypothetical protein [Acidobacteriota bacterium]